MIWGCLLQLHNLARLNPPYIAIFWGFFEDFISFLERGEGREKEKERYRDVREKHRLVASLMLPNLGPNPQSMHVP